MSDRFFTTARESATSGTLYKGWVSRDPEKCVPGVFDAVVLVLLSAQRSVRPVFHWDPADCDGEELCNALHRDLITELPAKVKKVIKERLAANKEKNQGARALSGTLTRGVCSAPHSGECVGREDLARGSA